MHVVITAAEICLHQEACLNALSHAGMHGSEEAHGTDHHHEEVDGEPDGEILHTH